MRIDELGPLIHPTVTDRIRVVSTSGRDYTSSDYCFSNNEVRTLGGGYLQSLNKLIQQLARQISARGQEPEAGSERPSKLRKCESGVCHSRPMVVELQSTPGFPIK